MCIRDRLNRYLVISLPAAGLRLREQLPDTGKQPCIILRQHEAKTEIAVVKAMKVGAVPNHHFTADSGLEESPGRYFGIEAAGQDKVGIGRVNLKLRNRGQSLDTAFTFLTDKGTGAFNVFLISEHDLPGGIRQGTDGPGIFCSINPCLLYTSICYGIEV